MSAINKEPVACWAPGGGYTRTAPSAEWCAFVDDETGDYVEGLMRCGYQRIGRSGTWGDEDFRLELDVFQHEKTKELIVDLSNTDAGVARVFVAGDHAEAFLFTEYLRIHEQVTRINNSDHEKVTHKAILSFIRHGHGKSTISEFGKTRDEANVRIAGERARREREQAAQSKA